MVVRTVRVRNFRRGRFPGRRAHSSLGGWRRLRAAVGLRRARLKEKDRVNFERCLCGALGVGLEAHNQG
ncbi:hypothetical protein TB2_034411 [Malus domestica]